MDEDLQEAFELFDSNQKGFLDFRELKAAMRAFGMEVNKQLVLTLFNELGKNQEEGIDQEEFFNIMKENLSSNFSKSEVTKIFDIFDTNNKGLIGFDELKLISKEIGENIDDNELREIIEEADINNDGYLDFEEFYSVMKKRDDIFYE